MSNRHCLCTGIPIVVQVKVSDLDENYANVSELEFGSGGVEFSKALHKTWG